MLDTSNHTRYNRYMRDMTPFRITTKAGKALWTKINNEHGSSVWGPVGDGIVAIEKELTERFIRLVEEHGEVNFMTEEQCKELILEIKLMNK